jgi:NAD(P)-dependent dehydrogenase (short-subunit alcohol dehydrogenase family)
MKHYSKRYGQSKLAQIGLTKDLAARYPAIKTVAIHPGRILTGMATSLQSEDMIAWVTMPIAPLFCVPVALGIRNHLWAGTSPDIVSGTYYEPVGVVGKLSPHATKTGFPQKLREWTDQALSAVKPLDERYSY